MASGERPIARPARRALAYTFALVAAWLGLLASADVSPAAAPGLEVAPGVFADGASASAWDRNHGAGVAPAATLGRRPRIIGGRAIGIERAPWQVAVLLSSARKGGNAFERQFCGGSLVTPTLVITAAHCMFEPKGSELVEIPARDLSVVSGRAVLSDSDEGQELAVREVILFRDGQGRPLYLSENNPWDVAALQLAEPSTTGGLIKLPGPDEDELWSFGRRARVTGWGATQPNGKGRSDRLLAVRQMTLGDRQCTSIFGERFDVETSVCAAWMSGGRSSCFGDSGGPLVVPTAQGDARLVGNVEGGASRCGEPGDPFYYGRLGSELLRTALDDVAVEFGGVPPGAIVGSGGTPPLDVGLEQGRELTWIHAQKICRGMRACRRASAGDCRRAGGGRVSCRSRIRLRSGAARRTCTETILWTADEGRIERERNGKDRCRTGPG